MITSENISLSKYKYILLFFFALISIHTLKAQNNPNVGYILDIEGEKVFIDFTTSNSTLKKGDLLKVVKEGEIMIHPVTKEKIKKKDEIISNLEIAEINDQYSVASAYPKNSIVRLVVGMKVHPVPISGGSSDSFKKSIAVQPIKAVGARGGYLGIYIGDLLTAQLFSSGKLKVIDRQSLGWQEDEIALSTKEVVDDKDMLLPGKTAGVDYFVIGTLFEPDVVEVETGIPIKGALSAAELVTGKNLGSKYVSDVNLKKLKAIVQITLRVVDVETGEIKFICTEMQQAEGKSEISLERGALGGLKLEGGATSFQNTVTGKAAQQAMVNLASYIIDYFIGNIKTNNFQGNIVAQGKKMDYETKKDDVNKSTSDNSQINIGDSVYFTENRDPYKLYNINFNIGKIVTITKKTIQVKSTSGQIIDIIINTDYYSPYFPLNKSQSYKRNIVFNNEVKEIFFFPGDTIVLFNNYEMKFTKSSLLAVEPKFQLGIQNVGKELKSIHLEKCIGIKDIYQILNSLNNTELQKLCLALTRKGGLVIGKVMETNERYNNCMIRYSYLQEGKILENEEEVKINKLIRLDQNFVGLINKNK